MRKTAARHAVHFFFRLDFPARPSVPSDHFAEIADNNAEVIKMEQPLNQKIPPEPRRTVLSEQDLRALSQRFGSTRSYQGSVVGITDERMRQLAEHFTP